MTFGELHYDLSGETVDYEIIIKDKRLTSLKGCPKEIKGDFVVSNSSLSDLKYAPEKVNNFYCDGNHLLHSLEGAPEVRDEFSCQGNTKLKNLVGLPSKIKASLWLAGCGLDNLTGCSTFIGGNLDLRNSKFKSKEHVFDEIIGNDVNVGRDIITDFGRFKFSDTKFYYKHKKIGKFRDFLEL